MQGAKAGHETTSVMACHPSSTANADATLPSSSPVRSISHSSTLGSTRETCRRLARWSSSAFHLIHASRTDISSTPRTPVRPDGRDRSRSCVITNRSSCMVLCTYACGEQGLLLLRQQARTLTWKNTKKEPKNNGKQKLYIVRSNVTVLRSIIAAPPVRRCSPTRESMRSYGQVTERAWTLHVSMHRVPPWQIGAFASFAPHDCQPVGTGSVQTSNMFASPVSEAPLAIRGRVFRRGLCLLARRLASVCANCVPLLISDGRPASR